MSLPRTRDGILAALYHDRHRETIKLSMLDIRELFSQPIRDFADLREQGLEPELQERFIRYRRAGGNLTRNREAARFLDPPFCKESKITREQEVSQYQKQKGKAK